MSKLKTVQKQEAAKSENASVRAGLNSPYFDLDSSIKVADMIYNRGGGSCTSDQLAAWLGYSTTRSGTYLTRVSAANKHFGLIEQTGDRFSVTERGKTILAPVMPEDAINAKVNAFLAVPLFSKVYDNYKGGQLPPEIGLKNLFQNTFKVLPDRVSQALRIFLNSAEQAGFFSTTGDRSRLVRPTASAPSSAVQSTPIKEEAPAPVEKARVGGGDGPTGGIDSAIAGLLRKLPQPGPWNAKEKKRFKDAFLSAIDFLYPDEGEAP
jgi:hypothetical protein